MSALSALEKRLTALVPPGTDFSRAPPDQRSLFELLAETAAATLRSSSLEVKEAQRSLEDALLRVTCGGWAGPAVRVTAANVMANLFFVGNEVALYSCVNELVAVAFADDDKKASRSGANRGVSLVAGYLSLRAAKRIGALDALTRLANKGHADAMRGAAGGVVAAAEKLLKRAPERAAAADGSAKGARAVRRAALRTVGAIVSSYSSSKANGSRDNGGKNKTSVPFRPLRPETRAAAAKLLLAAAAFDVPSKTADGASAAAQHALGADAGAVAAACAALGALATSPGGFDLWTDVSGEAGPFASLGDAVAWTLFSLLDHDDDDAAAAAAAALGKLAAARLRVKTPEERREEAARRTSVALRNGGEGASSSGDGGTSGGTGRGGSTTKTSTFGASFFSSKKRDTLSAEKNKNAAEKKAEAELAAAAHAARALDLERPGGMALWEDTVRKCFSMPVTIRARGDAEKRRVVRRSRKTKTSSSSTLFFKALYSRRRRFNAGIAEAWTLFVLEASRCALAEAPLPKHALVDLAETALRAFAPGAEVDFRDSTRTNTPFDAFDANDFNDPSHARLCAAHVVRHGALQHLDESGRRALTERLMELLARGGTRGGRERAGGDDGDDDAGGFPEARAGETKTRDEFATAFDKGRPPSASATLLCCVLSLRASGRVDGELFDTARVALFTSKAALECPLYAARAVGALAAAAPERAAALLRDATRIARAFLSAHQSQNVSANGGHILAEPADHLSARLGVCVAAVLVAEAEKFELGLPVRDVSDAAKAAFALATLPKTSQKTDSVSDVSKETLFEKNALSITRAFAWETVASALAFFAANGGHLFARDDSKKAKGLYVSGLNVKAVRDALADALDPLGLIAAVAETESEKEKAAEKKTASEAAASVSSAASRLASLSMFSPSKKSRPAAETSAMKTRNANERSGSSSYGATTTADSPASSLPGSPRRNTPGHSRSNSSLSQSAGMSAHSMNSTWAPAAESLLRAAAADAVAPFALFSRSENAGDTETARRDALLLLRDALSCACHPVPPRAGSSTSGLNAWPTDPETANAAATLRLRALEAFVLAPAFLFEDLPGGSAERRVDVDGDARRVFDAAVGACAALPESDLPIADEEHTTYVSSSPEQFLRRALNPADAPLGPWHGEGSDAASGSLRNFEGAADAPPRSPWRLSCLESSEPFREGDTAHASLAATLRFARARALARVAAESPARAPAVLAATALEAAAAANGDAFSGSGAAGAGRGFLSPKPSADDLLSGGAVTSAPASPLGSPAKPVNGRHRRAPSGGGGSGGLFALPGGAGGSLKAEENKKLDAATRAERAASSLTSACVASLAVAEAMAALFERKRSSQTKRAGDADEKDETDVAKEEELKKLRLETASSLAGVAAAVSGSRFAGAAHWRAAAELEAAAASIRDDAAAAADALRARAAELANTPVTRGGSVLSGVSHASSDDKGIRESTHVQKHRAAACASCASSFRRAGALAMAAATRPLASALAAAAAELDGTPFFLEASHLWAAHALGVVAAHAGPAFEKRAPATLELAFALLNSPEANDVVDVERLNKQTETEETRRKEVNIPARSVNASRAASSLRAACGRLVNAAVAAVGPELDAVSPAAASFFAFASALMDAVSDGGEGGATGAGTYAAFARGSSGAHSGDAATESSAARDGTSFRWPSSAFGDDESFRPSETLGDAACRHEAATYVQQLALFAPRVATPQRLVPRLRASLASGRPALRRAAAQTLKHLCERDANAVARAAAADGGGLEGDLMRFVEFSRGDGDGDGDGDPVAATHAKRALRLLTRNASERVSPASSMKTLAAVALWTPGGGSSFDGAGFDPSPSEGENQSQSEDGYSVTGHDGFRSASFRAPKLTTRLLAAALIAEAPTVLLMAARSFVGDFAYDVERDSFDNEFKNANARDDGDFPHATMSVADARAAVDCAYRLATAPAVALRPAGLSALRATLASLRGREDPDASAESAQGPGRKKTHMPLFAAQFQAQTLSALRAAREPDASPRCFAEGAHLAATAATCGLDAGDQRAKRLIRAFVREPIEAWLDEEDATDSRLLGANDAFAGTLENERRFRSDAEDCDSSSDSDEQILQTVSSPLTRRASASCAEGIVVRLRIAALVSSARLYLLDETEASDATNEQNEPPLNPRFSLALRWASIAADFALTLVQGADFGSVDAGSKRSEASARALPKALDVFPLSIVPKSLRETNAVALDLADAWGPCLDAATRALFAETSRDGLDMNDDESLDELPTNRNRSERYRTMRSFALLASALAKAQLLGSLRLVFNEDDEGPDAPLAKPLNPNAKNFTSSNATSSSPFAVKRGRPLDGRAALGARCLTRITAWTFRTSSEEDLALRRAVTAACAAAVTALDAGVGVAEEAESHTTAKTSGKELEKEPRGRVSIVKEARALGLVLAARASLDADAAASAVALAAGLARRRSSRFCVASASEICVAVRDSDERIRPTTTPLLLVTAVRTLLDTPEGIGSPFAGLFASLVSRADAETARSAKLALFFDDGKTNASLFASDDVVAALAAASVDECCVSRDDRTSLETNEQRRPCFVALEALSIFFSDASASKRRARSEAAAFKELQKCLRATSNEEKRRKTVSPTPTFLRFIGAACASATLQRLRLCASGKRRICSSRQKEDVVAAAEGLKFWVTATELFGTLADEDDDDDLIVKRQTAMIAAFLPLALEAIVPSERLGKEGEEEEEEEESFRENINGEEDDEYDASLNALASAAKTMTTSLAGAAPKAFRAAVAALRPDSTARLRAAMARDTGGNTSDVRRVGGVESKEHRVSSRAENRTSVLGTPPPPSFAAFAKTPNE